MLFTVWGELSVTVPKVPQNTASLPLTHAASAEPLNQFNEELSHVPLPPSPVPVVVLLLAALPSLSQYRVTARAAGRLVPSSKSGKAIRKIPVLARSIIQLGSIISVASS